MPTPTINPTEGLKEMLAKDLARDAVARLDNVVKAIATIPRSEGSEDDFLYNALNQATMAATELRCFLIEVEA